jgi:hypothetical protein
VAENQEERAERLAQVAVELVARVRDEPADANWRWFLAALPDPLDREHIAFVLAAAVPVDQPWSHLTRWAQLADVRELVAERYQIERRAS